MGDFGELADLDVALYRAVLRNSAYTQSDVAAVLGRTPEELDKSIARLTEMGLLRHGDTEVSEGSVASGLLVAVSPMLAEATVLGAEDLELGARRASLEQRRDSIRRLVTD